MKLLTFVITSALVALAGSSHAADTDKPLATDKEKASYGVGVNVAKRFKHEFIDLDIDAFVRGFRDTISDTKPALSEAEVEAALVKLRSNVAERTAQVGAQNKKEADEFLAKNKGEKGIITLPSGLQYQVLKDGTGATPTAQDTVRVHYRGTLLNGTEFDSSYRRNEPAVFEVGNVIPGWVEGLQKMKVGGKSKFWIPPQLAYGEQGQPPIPPNSLLVFEVELLGIQTAQNP